MFIVKKKKEKKEASNDRRYVTIDGWESTELFSLKTSLLPGEVMHKWCT